MSNFDNSRDEAESYLTWPLRGIIITENQNLKHPRIQHPSSLLRLHPFHPPACLAVFSTYSQENQRRWFALLSYHLWLWWNGEISDLDLWNYERDLWRPPIPDSELRCQMMDQSLSSSRRSRLTLRHGSPRLRLDWRKLPVSSLGMNMC